MMFENKRVGRERQAPCEGLIAESAYRNRYAFRAICFFTALGLLLTVIISSAPQTAASLVRLSLSEFRASSQTLSTDYGELAAVGAYTAQPAPAAEKAEPQTAAQSMAVKTPGDLSAYVTVMSAREAEEKLAAIQAEKDRLAAAIAASTAYNGYKSYIRLNTNGVPMSEKGDVAVDENGVPLHYAYMISGRATAYCTGYITSTGTKPMQGTVAVDPRMIPYGTRLYITSADGKYIYGCGVAEDTGGFIYTAKIPQVDLYMYSEDDAINWGWRAANIYVLY